MLDPQKLAAVHAESERQRIQFLEADLAVCSTFVDVFETESRIGDRDGAEQALAKAEVGYATIERFLPSVADCQQREELQQKLMRLRVRIDESRSTT